MFVNCDICKYRDDTHCECVHGEKFERAVISDPQRVSIADGIEYCGHCGYISKGVDGFAKFYCIRCGGLNLRKWEA